jgi:hypothetical protein
LLDDRCESFQTHTSVRVDVSGHFEDYWHGRSKNLRRSVRGLLNKLESEHLQVRLAVLQTPSEMNAAIGAHGSLEETGWKMRSGRPLSKGLIDTTFYADLLRTLAATNHARVFQLYLNDQLVASQFGIISGATLALLKTGYNDAFARFAPGRLLDYFMLQYLFECHEVERVEYCTIATEDDVRWSTAQRGIFEFYVYRNAMTKRAVWIARKAKGVLRALRHR